MQPKARILIAALNILLILALSGIAFASADGNTSTAFVEIAPTTTETPRAVPISTEPWSVETALGSAAARIEVATAMHEAVEAHLIEQRLAEIAEQKAAAERRLADLVPPTPTPDPEIAVVTPTAPDPAPAPPAPPIAAPAPTRGPNWDGLAQCESGGNWSINTGNGYYGGLQFHPQTWNGHGGQQYAAYAHQATREQQIAIAEKVLASQGRGAWPGCSAKGAW